MIKEGMLPADAGIIVENITTTAFIGQYLRTGMPLITKMLTVDGGAIAEPKKRYRPDRRAFFRCDCLLRRLQTPSQKADHGRPDDGDACV